MSDIGAKVSLSGYNVLSVADYLQLFNSSWPTLMIHDARSFTLDNIGADQVILKHNLGYVPAFLIIDTDTSYSFVPGGYRVDSYGVVSNGTDAGRVAVNSTELKYFTGGSGSSSHTFYYYVFRQDITKNYIAPKLSTNATHSGANRNFGIKVAKINKDIYSNDLRDYSIHSESRSPLLHRTGSGTPNVLVGLNTKSFTLNHDLGYVPLAYCYVNYGTNGEPYTKNGYYYMHGGPSGTNDLTFWTDSNNVWVEEYYGGFAGPTATAAFLVLKDPFLKDIVGITY